MDRQVFGNMVMGTQFFDLSTGETYRKVSETQALITTGGDVFSDARANIAPDAEFVAETPQGYQIANAAGENIQGDDGDSSGYFSFEILTHSIASAAIDGHADRVLYAIYEGDIESPEFVDTIEQ